MIRFEEKRLHKIEINPYRSPNWERLCSETDVLALELTVTATPVVVSNNK